jgi:protein-arginine kinase activator protein McsA
LLSKELKKAVEEENYEKAAKLRDRLKKLQAKSSASA